jgi:hypothetical protein
MIELPSVSRQVIIRQLGPWTTSPRNVAPFDLRSAISASRSSTSKAIVPPAAALGSSGMKLVSATQPPPGRSYSIHPLVALVPVHADSKPERLFVEPARPHDVADRVHHERDLLEHEPAPNVCCAARPRFQVTCLSGLMANLRSRRPLPPSIRGPKALAIRFARPASWRSGSASHRRRRPCSPCLPAASCQRRARPRRRQRRRSRYRRWSRRG